MPYRNISSMIGTSNIDNNSGTQQIEFIKDRLYYTWLSSLPPKQVDTHYFTIDDDLAYVAFYSDFGPSNIGHVWRFCHILRDKMEEPALEKKRIVLYSSLQNGKRCNAAWMMCAYAMLVLGRTPEESFKPISHISPPLLPYRDAGYGAATYHITILDCLKGLHKAISLRLFKLEEFNLEEYEFYEKVENGDFNWVLPGKFLAFATPRDEVGRATLPAHAQNNPLVIQGEHYRFQTVLNYFKSNKISTVLRLSNKQYDRRKFLDAGIDHIELYFPDGSCPTEHILRKFLEIAETRLDSGSKKGGAIAVHCKAGLGRTGSLIAAYMMKHYKFTAAEVIAYLRILRPGSVVGPQQNWLHSIQSVMHEWGDRHYQVTADLADGEVSEEEVDVDSKLGADDGGRTGLSVTSVIGLGGKSTKKPKEFSIPLQPRKGEIVSGLSMNLKSMSIVTSTPHYVTSSANLISSETSQNLLPRYNLRSSTNISKNSSALSLSSSTSPSSSASSSLLSTSSSLMVTGKMKIPRNNSVGIIKDDLNSSSPSSISTSRGSAKRRIKVG